MEGWTYNELPTPGVAVNVSEIPHVSLLFT